ncbi:MAG: hypothetical protein V1846_05370 [Candidatus Komeilibacteria bacterium]
MAESQDSAVDVEQARIELELSLPDLRLQLEALEAAQRVTTATLQLTFDV